MTSIAMAIRTTSKKKEPSGLTRTCSACGKAFPATLEYFYSTGRKPGQLRGDCKACHSALVAADLRRKYQDAEYRKGLRKQRKERYWSDPAYRKRCQDDSRERARARAERKREE